MTRGELIKQHDIKRVNVEGLINYFMRQHANVVTIWYDARTHEWVVYLIDEGGNQIGRGVRERTFENVVNMASNMLGDVDEFLYEPIGRIYGRTYGTMQ